MNGLGQATPTITRSNRRFCRELVLFVLLMCFSVRVPAQTACTPTVGSIQLSPTQFVGGVGPVPTEIPVTMSFSYSNPCDVPATLDFSDTSVAGPPPNMWLQMRFTDSNGFSIIKPMTIPPGASGTLTGVTAAHSGQLTVANTTTIGPVAATIDRSDGTQPPMRVLGPTITVTPNIPTIRLTVNPVSLTAKTNQTVNWQISDNSWPYQRRTFNFNPDGYLLLTGVQQLGVDFFARMECIQHRSNVSWVGTPQDGALPATSG